MATQSGRACDWSCRSPLSLARCAAEDQRQRCARDRPALTECHLVRSCEQRPCATPGPPRTHINMGSITSDELNFLVYRYLHESGAPLCPRAREREPDRPPSERSPPTRVLCASGTAADARSLTHLAH